ncbi:hypothetical protein L6452_16959 [Arctium lappa]|uniref:Uncharacterized protein n=1 Tax=Arctium lappa TaxID=4217 RepID=A0ACB9C285_ARCLA|nr:hypothetical protein L6452_16959 [Arctium lappa]
MSWLHPKTLTPLEDFRASSHNKGSTTLTLVPRDLRNNFNKGNFNNHSNKSRNFSLTTKLQAVQDSVGFRAQG